MGETMLRGRGVGDENLFPAPHGVPGGALIRNNPLSTSPAITPSHTHGVVDDGIQGYQQSAYNANYSNNTTNQYAGGGVGASGFGGQQQQQNFGGGRGAMPPQLQTAGGSGLGSFWEQ